MRITAIFLTLGLLLFSYGCMTSNQTGAAGGAVIGGAAGAIIDKDNPWRGAVIGAAVGAAIGVGISELSKKAAREAMEQGKPVAYTKGDTTVLAEPVGDYYKPSERTTCRKVRKRIWKNGKLIEDRIEEVCEGEKTESRY